MGGPPADVQAFQDQWRVEQGKDKTWSKLRYWKLELMKRKGSISKPHLNLFRISIEMIVSDGAARLAFLDPETFEPERDSVVRDGYGEVGFLNELEYVDGDTLANGWQTD